MDKGAHAARVLVLALRRAGADVSVLAAGNHRAGHGGRVFRMGPIDEALALNADIDSEL